MGDVQTVAPGPADAREFRPPIVERKTERPQDREPVPPNRNGATNGNGPQKKLGATNGSGPDEKLLGLEGMTPTSLARRLGRRS